MSVLRRLDKLEEKSGTVAEAIDADEEAPQLIITWPEDSTPETRAHNRKVREWYHARGRTWGDAPLVLSWADGSEVSPP